MGQVSSDLRANGLYEASPRRFRVRQVTQYANEGDKTGLGARPELASAPCLFECSISSSGRVLLERTDHRPNEYVQDPETGDLLLKVPYLPSITFKFHLDAPKPAESEGATISGLTFASAFSSRELSDLIEGKVKPAEDSVAFLGDFRGPTQAEFVWVWEPLGDRLGGWPIYFGFYEHDAVSHGLVPLVLGGFWIAEPYCTVPMVGTQDQDPDALETPTASDLQVPPRRRQDAAECAKEGISIGMQDNFSGQQLPAAPVAAAQRPMPELLAMPEDGPVFRSTVASLERQTPILKAHVKKLLKRSLLLHERFYAFIEAQQLFSMALVSAAENDLIALKPIAHWFSCTGDAALGITLLKQKSTLNDIVQYIYQPLQILYDMDIKPLELQKREFEDISSQYYSWMSRYLSGKKERKAPGNDHKFNEKRRAFELARFDYYASLVDVHGGRKLQHLVCQLAQFAQRASGNVAQMGIDTTAQVIPFIDDVVEDIAAATRDWDQQRASREELRRNLDRLNGDYEALLPLRDNIAGASASAGFADAVANTVNGSAIGSGADLSCAGAQGQVPNRSSSPQDGTPHKEGLLWALSRPGGLQDTRELNKQGLKWHKYWVVQDGGRVCEYSKWKQGLELHNEPILLTTASVRPATASDRRFCFEVVTPSYKRVYQAMSQDEVESWVRSINRGISSSLESMASREPSRSASTLVARGKTDKLELLTRKLSLRSDHRQKTLLSTFSPTHNHSSIQGRAYSYISSPITTPIATTLGVRHGSGLELLNRLRLDPSNRVCADCCSSENVDWVSINLVVVLCIHCSGAHRSLGTHISQIRSLTLDTVSFTLDLVAALEAVSNNQINAIWEARLAAKPAIDSDGARLAFIKRKYLDRQYAQRIDKPNAALRRAIVEQDVAKTCAALAAGADPNDVGNDNEPMLVNALRCAREGQETFPVAEILLLNGAQAPALEPPSLSAAARHFLLRKR